MTISMNFGKTENDSSVTGMVAREDLDGRVRIIVTDGENEVINRSLKGLPVMLALAGGLPQFVAWMATKAAESNVDLIKVVGWIEDNPTAQDELWDAFVAGDDVVVVLQGFMAAQETATADDSDA